MALSGILLISNRLSRRSATRTLSGILLISNRLSRRSATRAEVDEIESEFQVTLSGAMSLLLIALPNFILPIVLWFIFSH